MADIEKLRGDVSYWKEKIRVHEGEIIKAQGELAVAKRMYDQRKSELERAEAEKKRQSSPGKKY